MTLRNVYEFALIESNKLKAPSILLEDFIYLFNKAIQQYVNGVYGRAEYNQQSSDDIGFLQTTTTIDVSSSKNILVDDTIWEIELPSDYVHLLNCIAEFSGTEAKTKCKDSIEKTIASPCQRLTADLYPGILNNYYMRPSHTKPYYYIINHNTSKSAPTNPAMDGEEGYKPEQVEETDFRFFTLKPNGSRVVNQSTVKMEIHSGRSPWKLKKVYVTYLKAPKYYSMTQDEVLAIEDNTQVLEFPDYVCYEIINIYVRLFLENASDPRLRTNIPINQTIAVPGNK